MNNTFLATLKRSQEKKMLW